MERTQALDLIGERPDQTGIFVDFDGTLAAIVDHPQDAAPVEGAVDALSTLAEVFAVVGVVSGRGLDDLRQRLPVRGALLLGAYGRERSDRPMRRATEGWEAVGIAAATAAEQLPGVVIERKGAGVALHYRHAPELAAQVLVAASELATEFGLEVRPGRRVAELVVPGRGKGDALLDVVEERALRTVLFAGDDLADLEGFRLVRGSPVDAVLVAVLSEEAPDGLTAEADLVASGPDDVVALLAELASRGSG